MTEHDFVVDEKFVHSAFSLILTARLRDEIQLSELLYNYSTLYSVPISGFAYFRLLEGVKFF